jgi:MtrB/PioB family decaheme-associated outer membrane protein
MRIMRSIVVTALSLFALASAAAAQAPNTPPPQVGQDTGLSTLGDLGQVDFGFRGTGYVGDSDEARYQRYRDLRNGPFVEGFRWGRETDGAAWNIRANHVGYRDQQYIANYNNFGKLKASFEWNQIPLFFSEDTSTAFAASSPGLLKLDDLPRLVQSGGATSAIYNTASTPFDMRLKRSIADVRLVYSATANLDLSLAFKNTQKTGEQPWAGTFGFSNAVELPVPVDTRTTDLGVAAEWTNARGEVRVGYDGSFFRNTIDTLVWDNPLRSTDSPTAGPAQGRMMLWPDSTINAGSVSGLVKLPASSQATAYLSVGNWTQDAALIPFTINAALPPVPLDRPTADARAVVTATAFTYNARPMPHLWLNARFRSYDFDNRTPVFSVPTTVSYDTTVAAFAEGGTSPYSFTRKVFDVDASWTPITFAAFRAGYTRESVDQTFRTFDSTTENTLRLSADATGIQWLTLRAVYEHAKRVGTGLDEQSLDDIGEQVSLRQFDISDRNSNRFSTIVIVTPVSALSFNGTAFVGREDRPDTEFGLRSNDNNGVSIGFDFVPGRMLSVGGSYQYEKYTALQASRQANPGPQFDDPTRDWTTDSADRAHTFTASADLLKLFPKTDLRVAYDLSHAESVYVYGLAPNTTLPPVSQLPPVRNTRNRLSADGRYMLTRSIGIGLVYWFEKYNVEDFAFSPATLNAVAQPSFLSLGYLYRPYTANTLWARVTYLW